MKRRIAVFLLLILILSAVPAYGAEDILYDFMNKNDSSPMSVPPVVIDECETLSLTHEYVFAWGYQAGSDIRVFAWNQSENTNANTGSVYVYITGAGTNKELWLCNDTNETLTFKVNNAEMYLYSSETGLNLLATEWNYSTAIMPIKHYAQNGFVFLYIDGTYYTDSGRTEIAFPLSDPPVWPEVPEYPELPPEPEYPGLPDEPEFPIIESLEGITTDAAIIIPYINYISQKLERYFRYINIETATGIVAFNVLKVMLALMAVYPFMYLLGRLIRYCANAFDTAFVRKMEAGGLFGRMPDSSVHNAIEKIAEIPAFRKVLGRRK